MKTPSAEELQEKIATLKERQAKGLSYADTACRVVAPDYRIICALDSWYHLA